MSKKNYGHCALCGKYVRLSFEHIPPRAAFNSAPQKLITGETAIQTVTAGRKPWDMTGLPYQNQQRGMGRTSLCADCNSLTGALYGDEYKKLALAFSNLLQETNAPPHSFIHVEKSLIRPLPIIKQVCSMFCSINIGIKGMDELGAFVLDRDSHSFPKDKFRIGMYLMLGGLARQVGVSAICYTGGTEAKIVTVSEIAAYPMGFVLYLDPDEETIMPCTDITDFADYDYEETCNIEFVLPVYECNIMFPLDFRSKEEIAKE